MRLNKSIIIIGEISSGKSTLAKKLADELKIHRASFGDYLAFYSKEHSIPDSLRGDLQNLGQRMIDTDAIGFLDNVIEYSLPGAKNAIFEGVRHHVIVDSIKNISRQTITVYIEATYMQRLERFAKRGKGIDKVSTENTFQEASSHPVELQVKELKSNCDLVIESSESVEKDFSILVNFVKWFLDLS